MHSGEGKSYQGTLKETQQKECLVESISLYSVWQNTYIQEPHKETHEESRSRKSLGYLLFTISHSGKKVRYSDY